MANTESTLRHRPWKPRSGHAVTLLVGDFGSGKTEVSVNLSLQLARALGPGRVTIADLDLVNPYFRCREAREPLEREGVRVVAPLGDQESADLPILLPEVKGLLETEDAHAVLDVGGDATGSRVLAALSSWMPRGGFDFWFVANANRPFNDTVEGCLATIRRIEASAGLQVTGLVSNTHLMQDTTPEMVLEGAALADEVATVLGVPVALVAAMGSVVEKLPAGSLEHELLVMQRIMVPPWLRRDPPQAGASTNEGKD
jgi:hypothetical protein